MFGIKTIRHILINVNKTAARAVEGTDWIHKTAIPSTPNPKPLIRPIQPSKITLYLEPKPN